MSYLPRPLQDIAAQLKKGETPEPQTVRALLAWFDAQRRGYYIVRTIREALSELGISTDPDFELAYIDAPISFTIDTKAKTSATTLEFVDNEGMVEDTPSSELIAIPDPTYRVGMLRSANEGVVSVKPTASLEEATTLMLTHDYSQLPVMVNERDIKGVVGWTSIGSRLALGRLCETVSDCMDPAHIISHDTSLFTAIETIVQNDYVLIRHPDNRIGGIVTTADLSMQFRQLAEPFLLLSEIENHIRRIIQGKFSKDELTEVRDPSDEREVEGVQDLTFGEYVRLLEKPERWEKLKLKLDRVTFVHALDRVRRIRNDVMHFDPDPIADLDMTHLRDFARLMQVLRQTGAA